MLDTSCGFHPALRVAKLGRGRRRRRAAMRCLSLSLLCAAATAAKWPLGAFRDHWPVISPLTRYATVLSTHSSTFSSSYASTSLARTPRVAPAPLVCINQFTSIGCRCRSRGACMAIVGSAFSLAAGAAMPAPEPVPKVRAALSRQARMRRTSACVVKCGSHGSDVGPQTCDQGCRLVLLGLQAGTARVAGGEAGLAQRRGEA